MSKEKWSGYQWMWTTQADEYALYRFISRGVEYEIIVHLPSLRFITLEDDEAYIAVKEKMRQSGAKIIDSAQLQKLMGR